MNKSFAILTFLFVMTLSSQSTYACFCSFSQDTLKWIDGTVPFPGKSYVENYDGAIFSGRVLKVERVNGKIARESFDQVKVTFEVDTYWKGPSNPEIIVTTGKDYAACGIHFRKGETYLVFAPMIAGSLRTGICTLTSGYRDGSNLLRGLGEGKTPSKEPEKSSPNRSITY